MKKNKRLWQAISALVSTPINASVTSAPYGAARNFSRLRFKHPKRTVYLLGSEDSGLPEEILAQCKLVIKLPGRYSMNVSTAGSLVIYDRYIKTVRKDCFMNV